MARQRTHVRSLPAECVPLAVGFMPLPFGYGRGDGAIWVVKPVLAGGYSGGLRRPKRRDRWDGTLEGLESEGEGLLGSLQAGSGFIVVMKACRLYPRWQHGERVKQAGAKGPSQSGAG